MKRVEILRQQLSGARAWVGRWEVRFFWRRLAEGGALGGGLRAVGPGGRWWEGLGAGEAGEREMEEGAR